MKDYEKVGGGSYGIYREKKKKTDWAGIAVGIVLILIGIVIFA